MSLYTTGLNANLDQEGGGGLTYPPVQQGIPAALAAQNITLAQVQRAVRRLFTTRIQLVRCAVVRVFLFVLLSGQALLFLDKLF